MRSQAPNSGQEAEQKKSVFDRLGRQIENRRSANRRPSPGPPYGNYMSPPMHDPDFGRYSRDPHAQAELEWRYQNDRRHMVPFGRERHPSQLGPPPLPPHYDVGNRQPPYYPHPYHNNPPGPPQPPMMGPGSVSMGIHQRRPSPSYDRHGNLIRGGPMRMDPMEPHPQNMSPPRNFLPPGPMMHPGPHDMPPMRSMRMYPPQRWNEGMEMEFPLRGPLLQEEPFLESHKYPQQTIINHEAPNFPLLTSEVTRHTKWRERRDVITNLDRETAQSSSRTDSLRSTLQQTDQKTTVKRESGSNSNKANAAQSTPSSSATKNPGKVDKREDNSANGKSDSNQEKIGTTVKTEPQDISDGEIIDDDDSSDEDESDIGRPKDQARLIDNQDYVSKKELAQHYYESTKRRRLLDREDCSMDYETISDEELDSFMSDKKIDHGKLTGDGQRELVNKNSSEIELLNALGLDWAYLVEMSKQSKKETTSNCSALNRFSVANYLPTLGIKPELAGPELYDFISKVCR